MQPDSRHILTIRAFQIAEAIDIKRVRAEFRGDLIAAAPGELFFRRGAAAPDGNGERDTGYLYVMDYGVVTFAGHGEEEMSAVLERLQPFCENVLATRMGED